MNEHPSDYRYDTAVGPAASAVRELAAADLCRTCAPELFPFQTTDELEDLKEIVGQDRAISALTFGIGIPRDGYNLFAMGPEGVGRHTMVHQYLETEAAKRPAPFDWSYVFNFDSPHRPRALRLPPGRASQFCQDMARLVGDLRSVVPAAFESDEYRAKVREIDTEFNERQEQAIGAVGEHAGEKSIALIRTPAGFGFAPRLGDRVMTPEEFQKLPPEEQQRIEQLILGFQNEMEAAIHDMPKWRREAQRKLRELNRQFTRTAVNGLIEELRTTYRDLPEVVQYLVRVQEDMIDHAEIFRPSKDGEQPMLFGVPIPQPEGGEPFLRRYQVNVLVAHAEKSGAPVIHEDHPTHANLVGRTEHLAQMGALVTDFTLIKAGALHRANGGYLILDALKVLTQPLAWDALKRALRSREIRIESIGEALSLVSTVSLDPEPIPLDLKVVLIGQRHLYYLLHAHDPEFGELFKVVADFEEDMQRGPDNDLLYARMVATLIRKEKLHPFDRSAVARIVEYGIRRAEDVEKLSVQMNELNDLLCESDYHAVTAARNVVCGDDVQRAIDAREERSDRVRDRLREHILRGTLLIETSGERTGQVNALSVMQLGSFAFGTPHRVTARTRLGSGKVVDIEREVAMGGPLHSKGVLILSGFIAGRYAVNKPLSLAASLVFEQSYAGVEGDSASSAELYALLSALAEAPLRQSLAVTGSVNQHGKVQSIGGVNEKIEGFFDICRARGLTGEQGVLIPLSNVKNLMLRREIVDAVGAGRFHIYPVADIDQGIEILTGIPAGKRDASGGYPPGSINFKVEQRLSDFAERVRELAAGAKKVELPGAEQP